MKKFGLFMTVALLFAFVGCDSDDTEEPVVAAVAKPVVAVSENTPSSFGIEWEAVDKAAAYLCAVSVSDAAGKESEFSPETRTDETSLRFTGAAAGTKYTVRVKALAEADSQLADSEYAEIFIETPAEGASAQSFAFTVDPVGYESATVKVTPAITGESYFFTVVKNSLLVGKTNNAIVEMLKKEIDPASLVKGERTIETKWLEPETAYVAVAFGYDADKGASTSLLSRSEKFMTSTDPRMSIALSMQNVGDETLAVRCAPSDTGAFYCVTTVKAADMAGMSDHAVLVGELGALNAAIARSGWDAVAADQLRKGTSVYNATGLSIGTEYYVVAFGVAKSATGKAEETTRLFKARAKTLSPVAVVDFEMEVIDGSRFSDPSVRDKAGVGFQFKPNAATASYTYGVYRETILEYADSDIAAMMTGDPASMIDPKTDEDDNFRGYYIFNWGERAVVVTVGLNALGEVGPVRKQLIEIKKDGQGGGGTTTPPVERGDASVTIDYSVMNGGLVDPKYEGYPLLALHFTPDAKCVDYHWLDFLKVGALEQFGEDLLLEVLMDNEYKYDGSDTQDLAWYDRSMTEEDFWAMVYNKTILGVSYDIVAVGIDSEGRAGKVSSITVEYPESLDGAAAASVRIPSSTMFSRTAKLRSMSSLLEYSKEIRSLK